jgi:hypothetical protein
LWFFLKNSDAWRLLLKSEKLLLLNDIATPSSNV